MNILIFFTKNRVSQELKFFIFREPDTGGSNIPALNDLLNIYNISFGDQIYEGDYTLNDHTILYASGSSIVKFPKSKNSLLIYRDLNNQGEEFLFEKHIISNKVPILGLHQIDLQLNSGRIVVYGDSNCLDSSHLQKGFLLF